MIFVYNDYVSHDNAPIIDPNMEMPKIKIRFSRNLILSFLTVWVLIKNPLSVLSLAENRIKNIIQKRYIKRIKHSPLNMYLYKINT